MAKYVNAGNCKLILPSDRGTEIKPGDEVEISDKLIEKSAGVAGLVKDGSLVPAASKEAKAAKDAAAPPAPEPAGDEGNDAPTGK